MGKPVTISLKFTVNRGSILNRKVSIVEYTII